MLFSMSTIVAPGYICMSTLQVECYMDCPLPGMVLLLLFQLVDKHIVGGLTAGGVKG